MLNVVNVRIQLWYFIECLQALQTSLRLGLWYRVMAFASMSVALAWRVVREMSLLPSRKLQRAQRGATLRGMEWLEMRVALGVFFSGFFQILLRCFSSKMVSFRIL
jgi:hypothetical protein